MPAAVRSMISNCRANSGARGNLRKSRVHVQAEGEAWQLRPRGGRKKLPDAEKNAPAPAPAPALAPAWARTQTGRREAGRSKARECGTGRGRRDSGRGPAARGTTRLND